VEPQGQPGTGVTIMANDKKVISVAQRDLFRKYNWPAAEPITQQLRKLNEESK